MTDGQTSNVFARGDTFFGVCEAIGQDFGFNPNWLRVAFAVPLIYSPVLAIAAYAVVGVLVGISRLAFPNKSRNGAPLMADAPADQAEPAESVRPTFAEAA